MKPARDLGSDLRVVLKKNKPGRLATVEVVVDFDGGALLSRQEAELMPLEAPRSDVRRSLQRHVERGHLVSTQAGYRLT